jgi:hypothetical protein
LTDPLWDPLGKAREALRSIVADFGTSALSSPPVLENVLRDLLPGSPRQVSLIVAAAGAGVTSTLQEHVTQGIDPSTAVRLSSAQLAEQTPFDAAGCRWVTGEFALALGYQIAEGAIPNGQPALAVESGSEEGDNRSTITATDLPTQAVPVLVASSPLGRSASRRRAPAAWIVVLVVVLAASAGGGAIALAHHGPHRSPSTVRTTTTAPLAPGLARVATGAVASDPLSGKVALTFETYFGGINSHEYQRAYSTFSAQYGSIQSESAFAAAHATSSNTGVTVTSITQNGDGSLTVDLAFTSHQAPNDGPNPGETCTNWTLAYLLDPAPPSSSLTYLIVSASPVGLGHVAC